MGNFTDRNSSGRGFGNKGGFGKKGGFGGKGGFNKGGFGGRDGGKPNLFRATCSECGNGCEVPFKPTYGKPVYCTNCFKKERDQGGERGHDRERNHSFEPKKPDQSAEKLDEINQKLDRILRKLEAIKPTKEFIIEKKEEEEVKPKKTTKKKATKKKAKA